jgi:hypothetical protein
LIGIPLLHHQWAFDSIRTQVLQPFEKYLLPSGSSVLHPYYVFSTTNCHQNGPTNNVYQDDDDDDGYVSHQRHSNNQKYNHKNKIPFQIIPAIANIGILDGLRILNLAGELWDSVLITAGATVLHSTNALLHNMQYCVDSSNSNKNDHNRQQQHHQQHSSYHKSSSSSSISNIDIILIDPYEYVISYHIYNFNCNDKNTSNILLALSSTLNVNSRLINSDPLLTISSNSSSNSKNNNNNDNNKNSASSSSGKKHHIERPIVQSKLSDIELITTYKCFHYHNQIQPPTPQQSHVSHMIPFVASTDWLIHCLSLNEVLDIDYSDVFTLPLSPITHPYTYKTQTNERISKYDIVYFTLYKNTKKNYNNSDNIHNSKSYDINRNRNNNSRSNGRCDSLVNNLINCGSGNNKNSKNNTNLMSRKSFKHVNDDDNSKDNMKDTGDDRDIDIVYIGKIIDFSRATFNQSLKCKILPYCKCSSRHHNCSNYHDHDENNDCYDGSDDYCDPEKQLRIDSDSGIVIINAQQIISKIIVLSKEAYQSLYTYCKNDNDVYYVDKDVDDYYYHNYKNCYNFYNRKNNDSIDNHEKNNNNDNNNNDDDDVMIKKTKKHSQYYSKMSQDY